MTTRLLLITAILLSAAGVLARATEAENVPPVRPLQTLPFRIDRWQGREFPPLEADVLKVLGVDDYVSRAYGAASEPYIDLYVGYYASQRQGDTMHSPLNCMPGAGWQPVRQDRTTFDVAANDAATRAITVNQFIIQKGLDRQLVLYWYQSHGRIVASEYAGKAYMVYDAIRLNRTDGSLVRIITPIAGDDAAAEQAAAVRGREFAQKIFPELSAVLPS